MGVPVSAGAGRLGALAGVVAIAGAMLASAGAGANPLLTLVSSDPYTNTTSQHATELEPDTFAHGDTVVGAFQVGRFFNGGGSNVGWVRSGDGGATWTHGFLPGLTFNGDVTGSPDERVSDAAVAYDALHGAWLISSIPITSTVATPTVFVNRSTDDGLTWSNPIAIPPPVSNSVDLDKNWTVCDNVSASFKSHCYTELDNFGDGGRQLVSTSTDGGLTWSVPIQTAGHDKGLGGQPVVQPSGRVIVPFRAFNGQIQAYYSDDGGASWSAGKKIDNIRFHPVARAARRTT